MASELSSLRFPPVPSAYASSVCILGRRINDLVWPKARTQRLVRRDRKLLRQAYCLKNRYCEIKPLNDAALAGVVGTNKNIQCSKIEGCITNSLEALNSHRLKCFRHW